MRLDGNCDRCGEAVEILKHGDFKWVETPTSSHLLCEECEKDLMAQNEIWQAEHAKTIYNWVKAGKDVEANKA